MTSTANFTPSVKKEVYNIGNIGKLIITEEVQQIIDQLHNNIGSTEWSGMLFYKLIEGDIQNPKNLVFETVFLYPMNVGSHAYTEFEYDEGIVNACDLCEETLEVSRGLVH
ncbi:MAG: hypothetical protein EOL97_09005 [Spirochaetia bacterium]|nr:hypothetical protein [Spirochaetia bacterium]